MVSEVLCGVVAAIALGWIWQFFRQRRAMAREIAAMSEALTRSNQARQRFLEAISHDLRQPLQAIELMAAGLKRRQADPEAGHLVGGILSSLTTMRRMLSGLMDMSRLESTAMGVELADVAIDSLFGPIEAEFASVVAAQGLVLNVIRTGLVAWTDRTMLDCILRNFVSNAARYTRAGSVTVSCSRVGDQIEVIVADTGPGIPKAELSRIFDEFYRVPATAKRTEGLGLGLAMVRRMVKLLDVTLEVSSAIGSGTSFKLLLPAASARTAVALALPDPAAAAAAEASGPAWMLAGSHVLVLEDDEGIRTGLDRELTARGMVVTAAASPSAAYALLSAATRGCFDIALVDHDLGADITGPEFLDSVAARLGIAMPALILSGTRDFDVIAQLQHGDYPWLAKPVDMEVLLREMGRIATGVSATV